MKLLKFIILSCFICSLAYAEIVQTHDLQQIKETILKSDKDTLVIFDVDHVLLKPKDHIFSDVKNPKVKNFFDVVLTDLEQKYSKQEMDELHSIILQTCKMIPVTTETPEFFNALLKSGYKLLGLTKSGTGRFGRINSMEKWRINHLREVGISFHREYPNMRAGKLEKYFANTKKDNSVHDCTPAVDEGIIFTCFMDKGDVLDAYLQETKIKPKKIIFVDDRLDNIQAVAEFCAKENIDYIGFEYTAVQEQFKNISADLRTAKLQFAVLEKTKIWLEDAQAAEVLANLDRNLEKPQGISEYGSTF